MRFYNWFILYRLPISFLFVGLAIWVNVYAGFWPAFPLYLFFLFLLVAHFLFGPLRLVQVYMEAGDMQKAEAVLRSVRFPKLLYKPVRSVYYTVQGSLAMAHQDFETAEKHMQKSLDLGLPVKEAEGANKLQLGMLALQKGDLQRAESLFKQALQDGVPDADSKAMVLLQLSSLSIHKRLFRQARDYFRRAKQLRVQHEEIKAQIKQMDKYISRLPG